MVKDPNIRFAEYSDKESVLSLLNSVFSEQQRSNLKRGNEFWDWKYFDSPFGHSLLSVVESNNEIVGVANLWPWEFQCRGEILRALQPCDSAVHQEFRGKGLFKKTRIHGLEKAKKEGYDLIFNFPNSNSLPAYRSLGWDFMGMIPWRVKVLKPMNIVKGLFKQGKSRTLDLDSAYELDVKLLDKLTEQAISFDGFLKINRVEGFHEWRYQDHPTRSYGMIHYDKGRKQTAAVFTVNQKGRNTEMAVVDLVGAPRNTIPLFSQINDVAKQLDVDFVVVMDNPKFKSAELWKLGYFPKKLKNMVVLPVNIGIEDKVTSYVNWSLVAGLHDSI